MKAEQEKDLPYSGKFLDWCKFSYISYDASPYENKIYEKFYIRNFNHVKYTCTCQTSGHGIPACAHMKIRIRKFILKALRPFI